MWIKKASMDEAALDGGSDVASLGDIADAKTAIVVHSTAIVGGASSGTGSSSSSHVTPKEKRKLAKDAEDHSDTMRFFYGKKSRA